MSISEYEMFGVLPPANRDDQLKAFSRQVKHQLVILEHSHGETIESAMPRHQMANCKLKEYDRTGDKSELVQAAAWIFSEWVA